TCALPISARRRRGPLRPRRGGQPAGHAGGHEEAGRPALAAAGQGGARPGAGRRAALRRLLRRPRPLPRRRGLQARAAGRRAAPGHRRAGACPGRRPRQGECRAGTGAAMNGNNDKNAPASSARRRVLGAAGAALAGLAAAGRAAAAPPAGPAEGPGPGAQVTDAPLSTHTQDRVPFLGAHQAGIVTPRPSHGMVASFFVLAEHRKDLKRLFHVLTERIAFLTQGGKEPELDPKLPPPSSGLLGPVVQPDALTVTVSLGASMFDDERYGLAR